jgi:hypothetical protein
MIMEELKFSSCVLGLATMILVLSALSSCNKGEEPDTPIIDLEASTIDYELDALGGCQCTGTVRLTGKVKNIGNTNFSSGPKQQFIQLIQKPLGTSTETVIKHHEFSTLAADAEIEVTIVIPWDVAIEFQPEYILRISYDPDIYIDGNSNNDDTNSTNNTFTLSGFDINGVFN